MQMIISPRRLADWQSHSDLRSVAVQPCYGLIKVRLLGLRMKKFLSLSVLSLCLCVISGCDSETNAPFGVKWNTRIDRFPSDSLMTVNRVSLSDDEEMIYSTTAPKNELDGGNYRFYFSHQKLVKITFNTYDITGGDVEGKAKSTYEHYKKSITEMLGAPSKTDERVSSNGFRFIPCVTNSECGSWKSYFGNATTTAVLSIEMGLNQDGYKETSNSARVSITFKPK